MKWVAISGSWRHSNVQIVHDVQAAVTAVMHGGDGIVTGGALGVDLVATQTALQYDPTARRTIVILPTSLEIYAAHYTARAAEGVITHGQAQELLRVLRGVQQRNMSALVELDAQAVNQASYYARNTAVLDRADELLAFQVNDSQGTQDTIDKARARHLSVSVKRYTIHV